jgi:hypothetical protein
MTSFADGTCVVSGDRSCRSVECVLQVTTKALSLLHDGCAKAMNEGPYEHDQQLLSSHSTAALLLHDGANDGGVIKLHRTSPFNLYGGATTSTRAEATNTRWGRHSRHRVLLSPFSLLNRFHLGDAQETGKQEVQTNEFNLLYPKEIAEYTVFFLRPFG